MMMMKFGALARPLNLEKSEGVGAPGPVQMRWHAHHESYAVV